MHNSDNLPLSSEMEWFREIRRLHASERDAPAPAHSLPDEVLVQIFVEVMAFVKEDPRPLILLTHVCSHWRSVALSTPSLWTSRFPPTPEGLRTFLRRSASAPLQMTLGDGIHENVVETWPIFRSHMWHTSQLTLRSIGPSKDVDVENTLKDIIKNIHPCIESLSIDFKPTKMDSQTWSTLFHQRHGPDANLFPRLRHISFYDFSFNWGCGILKDLQTLIIENDLSLAPCRAKVDGLLDVVAACPRLEHLKLQLTSPKRGPIIRRVPFPTKFPEQQTPMPCLRTAVVSESLGGAFLTRFTLPVIESITVETRIKNLAASEETATLEALSGILNRPGHSLNALNITIHTTGPRGANVNILGNIWLPSATAADRLPHGSKGGTSELPIGKVSFKIAYDPDIEIEPEVFMNAIFKADSSDLAQLVCSCSRVSSAKWTRIFEKMPNLKMLSLNADIRHAPEEIFLALDPYSQSVFRSTIFGTAECKEQGLLLPNLDLLMFDDILTPDELRDDYEHLQTDAVWIQYDAWHKAGLLRQLIRYLKMRSEHGYPPLKVLTGLGVIPSSATIEEIESYVEEFMELFEDMDSLRRENTAS